MQSLKTCPERLNFLTAEGLFPGKKASSSLPQENTLISRNNANILIDTNDTNKTC
jgi:hypothetical protein